MHLIPSDSDLRRSGAGPARVRLVDNIAVRAVRKRGSERRAPLAIAVVDRYEADLTCAA